MMSKAMAEELLQDAEREERLAAMFRANGLTETAARCEEVAARARDIAGIITEKGITFSVDETASRAPVRNQMIADVELEPPALALAGAEQQQQRDERRPHQAASSAVSRADSASTCPARSRTALHSA
jgi:hypothetical protein